MTVNKEQLKMSTRQFDVMALPYARGEMIYFCGRILLLISGSEVMHSLWIASYAIRWSFRNSTIQSTDETLLQSVTLLVITPSSIKRFRLKSTCELSKNLDKKDIPN